jgi:proline iminopeptidase
VASAHDPQAYRIVLFDQRGCGRSRPYAGAPTSDLAANTTHHLIADIELLRRHLRIERWLVLGGSWGSTLALAYAQRHRDRVTEIVLFSVGTTTRREVEWVTRHAGRFFPAAWMRFRDGCPSTTATAAWSGPTAGCWTTPTRASAPGPRRTGANASRPKE